MKLEPFDPNLIARDGDVGDGPYSINGKNGAFKFNLQTLGTHLFFLGSSGSGKTNAIFQFVKVIKDSIMTENDVMIVFDTKGDYCNEFFSNKRDDLILTNEPKTFQTLDPGANLPDRIWNVFEEIKADSEDYWEQNAYEISRIIYDDKIRRTQQPFFPEAAANITRAAMIALLRKAKEGGENASNDKLVSILSSGDQMRLSALINRYEDLRGASQYISEKGTQTQGIVSEIQNAIYELFNGAFSRQGSFSIRSFVRKKKSRTLFIEYDLKWGRSLTPIYRLLIDLAIKESLSRSNQTKGNVYFVIDEFGLLPNLYHIDDGINFGREQRTKFLVGTQNISQILAAYEEGRGKSILSNFGTVFCFRLNDEESRNLVKSRYGKHMVKITDRSPVPSEPLIHDITEASVIGDPNIALLPDCCSIISRSGALPNYFQFKFYERKPPLPNYTNPSSPLYAPNWRTVDK